MIQVEVAYAERSRQFLERVRLAAGATVADAIEACGVATAFGIDTDPLDAGIWSRPVSRERLLRDGDRVELYRPLQVDPKEARRRRAEKARAESRARAPQQRRD